MDKNKEPQLNRFEPDALTLDGKQTWRTVPNSTEEEQIEGAQPRVAPDRRDEHGRKRGDSNNWKEGHSYSA
jgi:hypothetical protein